MVVEPTIETAQDVLKAQKEEAGLLEDLSVIIAGMQTLNHDRTETFDHLVEAHVTEMNTLKRQHAEVIAKLRSNHEEEIRALKSEHCKVLEANEGNISALRKGLTSLVAYASDVLQIASDPGIGSTDSLATQVDTEDEVCGSDPEEPNSSSQFSGHTGSWQRDPRTHTEASTICANDSPLSVLSFTANQTTQRAETFPDFWSTIEAKRGQAYLDDIISPPNENNLEIILGTEGDDLRQEQDSEESSEIGWTQPMRKLHSPSEHTERDPIECFGYRKETKKSDHILFEIPDVSELYSIERLLENTLGMEWAYDPRDSNIRYRRDW